MAAKLDGRVKRIERAVRDLQRRAIDEAAYEPLLESKRPFDWRGFRRLLRELFSVEHPEHLASWADAYQRQRITDESKITD